MSKRYLVFGMILFDETNFGAVRRRYGVEQRDMRAERLLVMTGLINFGASTR